MSDGVMKEAAKQELRRLAKNAALARVDRQINGLRRRIAHDRALITELENARREICEGELQ